MEAPAGARAAHTRGRARGRARRPRAHARRRAWARACALARGSRHLSGLLGWALISVGHGPKSSPETDERGPTPEAGARRAKRRAPAGAKAGEGGPGRFRRAPAHRRVLCWAPRGGRVGWVGPTCLLSQTQAEGHNCILVAAGTVRHTRYKGDGIGYPAPPPYCERGASSNGNRWSARRGRRHRGLAPSGADARARARRGWLDPHVWRPP